MGKRIKINSEAKLGTPRPPIGFNPEAKKTGKSKIILHKKELTPTEVAKPSGLEPNSTGPRHSLIGRHGEVLNYFRAEGASKNLSMHTNEKVEVIPTHETIFNGDALNRMKQRLGGLVDAYTQIRGNYEQGNWSHGAYVEKGHELTKEYGVHSKDVLDALAHAYEGYHDKSTTSFNRAINGVNNASLKQNLEQIKSKTQIEFKYSRVQSPHRTEAMLRGSVVESLELMKVPKEKWADVTKKMHDNYTTLEVNDNHKQDVANIMDAIRRERYSNTSIDPVNELTNRIHEHRELSQFSSPEQVARLVTASLSKIENDEEAGSTTIPKYFIGFGVDMGLLAKATKKAKGN